MLRMAALALALLAAGAPAGAEEYRLVSGDLLSIVMTGGEEPIEARIDAEGRVGLPGIGRIGLADLTLAAAEAALREAAIATGRYAGPVPVVSVLEHAPIFVVGDVRNPGAYAYSAHLTAATALGLAGGPSLVALDPDRAALLEVEIMAERRALETEIARAMLRGLRLQAQIAEKPELAVDEATRAGILRSSADFAAIHAAEAEILRSDLDFSARMLAHWREALAETEIEIRLLSERIETQREVTRIQAEELANAERLVERGVRASGALLDFQRLATQAKADLLQIETALAQARIRRTDLAQDMLKYQSERRARLLDERSAEAERLDGARQKLRAAEDKQMLVAGRGGEGYRISYAIRRRAGGGTELLAVAGDVALKPGDTVIVTSELPGLDPA